MSVETYSQNNPENLQKINASIVTRTVPFGTLDVTVPHNLNRYPAVRVYFTNSSINNLILVISGEITFGTTITDTHWGNTQVYYTVDRTNIYLTFSNGNLTDRIITAYYIIYGDRVT